METAFGLVLPGPPAFSRVLTLRHRRRGRRAAVRDVAGIPERVQRQCLFRQVVVDVVVGPGRERVHLHHAPSGVPCDDRRIGALWRVDALEARDPRAVACDGLLERLHLALLAATRPPAHVLVHGHFGMRHREVELPRLTQVLDERQRLAKVVPGVEEDDLDVGLGLSHEVDEHHVLERARDDRVAELTDRPGDGFRRCVADGERLEATRDRPQLGRVRTRAIAHSPPLARRMGPLVLGCPIVLYLTKSVSFSQCAMPAPDPGHLPGWARPGRRG